MNIELPTTFQEVVNCIETRRSGAEVCNMERVEFIAELVNTAGYGLPSLTMKVGTLQVLREVIRRYCVVSAVRRNRHAVEQMVLGNDFLSVTFMVERKGKQMRMEVFRRADYPC